MFWTIGEQRIYVHFTAICSSAQTFAHLQYLAALPGGWFGSRLDHVNTINELDWSSCGTTPRPPPLQGFGVIVLLCNYWVHTLTNETHHGGKRTRVQHLRCENTLNGKIQYMPCIVLLYVIWYCNWFVYMYVYIFTYVQILFALQIWCCLSYILFQWQ